MGPKHVPHGPRDRDPAPRPAIVAASKRAEVLPRSTSSWAVAIAMKPRMDGTLAAVDAPSSTRVAAQHPQVRGEAGHDDGHEPEDGAELHHAVMSVPVREDAEQRRQDQLRDEERGREQTQLEGADLAGRRAPAASRGSTRAARR